MVQWVIYHISSTITINLAITNYKLNIPISWRVSISCSCTIKQKTKKNSVKHAAAYCWLLITPECHSKPKPKHSWCCNQQICAETQGHSGTNRIEADSKPVFCWFICQLIMTWMHMEYFHIQSYLDFFFSKSVFYKYKKNRDIFLDNKSWKISGMIAGEWNVHLFRAVILHLHYCFQPQVQWCPLQHLVLAPGGLRVQFEMSPSAPQLAPVEVTVSPLLFPTPPEKNQN